MKRQYTLLTCLLSMCLSTFAQVELQEATLLGNWDNPDLVGSQAYANVYNDVWGIAYEGREYAVIGSTAGTHFLDVTDPTDIREMAFVAGAADGPQIIHRDYHHYGCYLYAVADEGASSTLQIINFSGLPNSVEVVYDSNETLRRSHNIFIDSLQAKLYCLAASGGAPQFSPMRIYDISNPEEPVYLAEYGNFGGLQAGHVHDAYVHDGLAFLNCGYDGFAMVDFTDPMNPQTLGTLTSYNYQGYNHSGWPSNDGQYYYLADENHGAPMKVLDVSQPDDIMDIGLIDAPGDSLEITIPHNQLVACDYLYVSYYYDGLMVYDISNPANPVPAWYYDTSDWIFDNNYRGAWGVYPYLPSGNVLVSDMQNGLFVISGPGDDCSQKTESVANCATPNTVEDLPQLAGVSVYPRPTSGELSVQLPTHIQAENTNWRITDLSGRTLLSGRANWAGGVQTIDLSSLPTGLYVLRAETSEWQLVEKVVKQ